MDNIQTWTLNINPSEDTSKRKPRMPLSTLVFHYSPMYTMEQMLYKLMEGSPTKHHATTPSKVNLGGLYIVPKVGNLEVGK